MRHALVLHQVKLQQQSFAAFEKTLNLRLKWKQVMPLVKLGGIDIRTVSQIAIPPLLFSITRSHHLLLYSSPAGPTDQSCL